MNSDLPPTPENEGQVVFFGLSAQLSREKNPLLFQDQVEDETDEGTLPAGDECADDDEKQTHLIYLSFRCGLKVL